MSIPPEYQNDGPGNGGWPLGLPPDWIKYLEERAVRPEIARQRGYRHLLAGRRRNNLDGDYSITHGLGSRGGLLMPLRGLLDPDGDARQLRYPLGDEPERQGKPQKFKSPDKQMPVLATHPATIDRVLSQDIPDMIICEGTTRLDALAGFGIPAVAIAGAYNWRGGKAPVSLGDWERLPIRGRRFWLAFDGDVATNPSVHQAAERLAKFLKGKGADNIGVLLLPENLGLDDWLYRERLPDADAVIEGLRRHLHSEIGRRPNKSKTPKDLIDPWETIAEYHEDTTGRRHLYERSRDTWYEYAKPVWREVVDDGKGIVDGLVQRHYEHAQAMLDKGEKDAAAELGRRAVVQSQVGNIRSVLWASLRSICRGTLPQPQPHDLATVDGVVDMRSGRLRDHSREDGTRGVTVGRYLPAAAADLRNLLRQHLNTVLTDAGFEAFIGFVGLALSGRAQSYSGSLVLICGPAGSGKGGIVKLLHGALGQRALSVKTAWLDQQKQSDADATLYKILSERPLLITIDEVGNLTRGHLTKLLDVSGDSPQSARRPYGRTPIEGKISATFWSTCVDVPRLGLQTGLGRRLGILRTGGEIEASRRIVEYPAELYDAVITLGVQSAAAVFRDGYAGPPLDADAQAATFAEIDPVGNWVDSLPSEWHGRTLADAWEKCREDLGDDSITTQLFGRRVKVSKRWQAAKQRSTGRVLRLKNPEPEPTEPEPAAGGIRNCLDCGKPCYGERCRDCRGDEQPRVMPRFGIRPALDALADRGVAALDAEGVPPDVAEDALNTLSDWLERARPGMAAAALEGTTQYLNESMVRGYLALRGMAFPAENGGAEPEPGGNDAEPDNQ